MSAAAAARSVLRSTAARLSSGARVTTGPKAKPSSSAFRFSTPKPSRPRILRSPVELSCCVESMLPYHTATASALLTSMLSASPRTYGWTFEDCNDDV